MSALALRLEPGPVLDCEPRLVAEISLRQLVARLKPREQSVVLARLNGYTGAEIARAIGVSATRVFQLERMAQRKMRALVYEDLRPAIKRDIRWKRERSLFIRLGIRRWEIRPECAL